MKALFSSSRFLRVPRIVAFTVAFGFLLCPITTPAVTNWFDTATNTAPLDGGAGNWADANWKTASNSLGGANWTSGYDAWFQPTSPLTNNLGGNTYTAGVFYANTTLGMVVLTNGTLAINGIVSTGSNSNLVLNLTSLSLGAGGISNNAGGSSKVINLGTNATLTANQTWIMAGGNVSIAGQVNLGGNDLSMFHAVSGSQTISANLGGNGNVFVTATNGGANQFLFTGTNTYTGSTLVLGTLAFQGTANPIQATGVISNQGQIKLTGSGGTVGLGIIGSQIVGTGVVNMASSGTSTTFLLTNANSYSGGTLLSGISRLALSNDLALGSGMVTISATGNLSSAGTSVRTLANNFLITNSLSVTFGNASETGLMNLTGRVDLAGAMQSVTISSPVIFGGAVSNGGLTKLGTGTLTLSNPNNSYALGTSNNAGTIVLAADNVLGSGLLIMNAGNLQSADASTRTLTNNFSLAGSPHFNDTATGALVLNGAFGDLGTTPRTLTVTSNTVTIASVLTNTAGFLKAGTGILVLTGTNSFTGQVKIQGGVLRANEGAGLPSTANLAFGGGTTGGLLETIGATNFSRNLGTGAGQVDMTGSGGFSASGGQLTINIGGAGATLTYASTANFLTNGSILYLGSPVSDSSVIFQNGLDLNGGLRTIRVDTPAGAGYAQLTGLVTNGGLTKAGAGTLILANAGLTNLAFSSSNAGAIRLTGGQIFARTLNLGAAGTDSASLIVDGPSASVLVTNVAGTASSSIGTSNQLVVINGGRLTMLTTNTGGSLSFGGTGVGNILLVAGTNSVASLQTAGFALGSSGQASLVVSNTGVASFNGMFQVGSGTGGSNQNSILISDVGSVVTNSGEFRLGDRTSFNTLLVSNGGRLAVGGNASIGNQGGGVAWSNSAVVTGPGSAWINLGSTFTVGGSGSFNSLLINSGGVMVAVASTLGTSSASISNSVVVAGSGSTWTNTSTLTVGASGSFNTLIVTGGASVVSLAATIGSSAGSSNNAVLVADGGTWAIGGTLTLGGNATSYGNSLVVSNGGRVYSSGTSLLGTGKGAPLGKIMLTGDGTVWTNAGLRFDGQSNELDVVNGAVFQGVDTQIGGTTATSMSSNNTVVVANRGAFTNLGLLSIGNFGNGSRFLVTNGGIVYVGGSVDVGNVSANPSAGQTLTNNLLMVEGANSRMTVIGDVTVGGRPNLVTYGLGYVVVSNGAQLVAGNVYVSPRAVNPNCTFDLSGAGSLVQASSFYVGQDASVTTGTGGLARITGGATLDVAALKTGAGNDYITNVGGVYQFSAASPTITANTPNSITLSNGWISFRDSAGVNVKGNWGVGNGGRQLTNIVFSGDNVFRLNNSSTTNSGQDYVFNTNLGATNYTRFEMINGTTLWQGGSLTIGANGTMLASNTLATIQAIATNAGNITVVNAIATWASNVVLNGGVFVTQNATNQFNGGLSLAAGQALTFTTGTSRVDGSISNAAGTTINAVNANVTFGGPVTISGLYSSDPSTNTFLTNVTMTASGALQGSNGDLFVFQKELFMQSTNASQFSLSQSAVLFTNSATHVMSLSNSGSLNIGQGFASFAEVATNFAIGQLSIAQGNQLILLGNKDSLTNALYVGWLDIQGLGSGGLLTNTLADVSNTLVTALSLPNINLYYDVYDTRNDWLTQWLPPSSGGGYDLWGGGLLLPIPEASSTALLLGALAVAAAARLRRQPSEG